MKIYYEKEIYCKNLNIVVYLIITLHGASLVYTSKEFVLIDNRKLLKGLRVHVNKFVGTAQTI